MYAHKVIDSETYEVRRARLKRMMAVYDGSRAKAQAVAAVLEAEQPAPVPYTGEVKWLVSPVVDLMFVCGLAPWIFGLLACFLLGAEPGSRTVSGGTHQSVFNVFFVVVALLIGEGHQFTSILRLHFSRKKWKLTWGEKMPFVGIYLAVALILSFGGNTMLPADSSLRKGMQFGLDFVSSFISPAAQMMGGLGMLLFPVVLTHHFVAQARGIGMMYCGTSGYRLTKLQNSCLRGSAWLMLVAGACGMAAPFGTTDFVFQTSADELIIGSRVLAVLSVILFGVPTIVRGLMKGEWLPLPAALLWLNLAAYLLLPLNVSIFVWLFVPIFYHASQHWIMAWATQQRESAAAGRPVSPLLDMLRLVLPVQAVSLVVLFSPLWTQPGVSLSSADATLSLGFSMTVFYLHYFADRIVWRPR